MTQNILGIDTAGRTLSAGVLTAGGDEIDVQIPEPYQHSRLLLTVVQDVLSRAGIGLSDLDLIAVSRGPGSYTGLRLGAMAAKVLAWSAGIPVAGVDSLAVIAANVEGAPAAACLPARRGQIYARLYGGPAVPLSPLFEGNTAAVLAQIAYEHPQGPIVFVGEGIRDNIDLLRQVMPHRAQLAPPPMDQPKGSMVARLARKMLDDDPPVDAISFTPHYGGWQVPEG